MKEPLKHHQACGFGFAIRSYNQCRVSYGSAVVDRYLSHFGEYIRNEFPKKYCFYLDNGHFLIVSPGFMDIHAAIAKIHQQFKDPWIREGESASFDIGCCYIDNRLNYSSPAELRESLELAFNDIDTLEHKDIVVDEKYKQRAERQTHIRKILRKAIETDSIEIFLQPLMDAKTEELTGAEALARLRDDDGTIIPPGDFIELSNSIGVINALDDQVFDKTCQFISAGGLTRCNMNWIHVNLAPTQCLNLDLADHLNEIRRRYFIPFFTIRLELIEDGALNPNGKKQINLLKEMGFDIVLDDYGTGYSNASRMKDLPFSEIKIDISLVKDYCSHPDPYLPNLVSTMHALGLMITAEGIETKEMADKMKALGVYQDHVVCEDAAKRGIYVAYSPYGNHFTVAEGAVALTLAMTKHICEYNTKVRTPEGIKAKMAIELSGATVGVLGLGNIARSYAEKMFYGMNAHIIAYDPFIDPAIVPSYITMVETMEEVFQQADVVSLHIPGERYNKDLINKKHFDLMKPTAYFLNTARDILVNNDDLYDALKNGKIAGAAADVNYEEFPDGKKLLELDNFINTPHAMAFSDGSLMRSGRNCYREICQVTLEGKEPKYWVNQKGFIPKK